MIKANFDLLFTSGKLLLHEAWTNLCFPLADVLIGVFDYDITP